MLQLGEIATPQWHSLLQALVGAAITAGVGDFPLLDSDRASVLPPSNSTSEAEFEQEELPLSSPRSRLFSKITDWNSGPNSGAPVKPALAIVDLEVGS